jgi:hypothetical protein
MQNETRESHEIVQALHDKLNSKPPFTVSFHDIDRLIDAPLGTCRNIRDRKTKDSGYLDALVRIEKQYHIII